MSSMFNTKIIFYIILCKEYICYIKLYFYNSFKIIVYLLHAIFKIFPKSPEFPGMIQNTWQDTAFNEQSFCKQGKKPKQKWVWFMAQFSSLCKESSQGQNVLGYLFKAHTFARSKFTCSMKSSFMELMLCLSLSLKLEKNKTKQINNHAFVHSLVLTSSTANKKLECVFLFSLWIW